MRGFTTDLLALWHARRKTIVFVTHDSAEAIALGDRTLVLTPGPARVQSEHRIDLARPRDVHDLYATDGFADLYSAIRKDLR